MFSSAQLKRLIVPLVIQMVLVMLVGMLDTVMVSSAGEAAISGVSIVNEVNYLVIAVMDALATGGAVVVSQFIGSKDDERTSKSSNQLILVAIIIPTILMIVCLTLKRQILGLLYGGIEESVMEAAVEYFWITALSFPFLGIYNACCALYRSISKTKEIMYTSMFMNVLNILGNYIGVYKLNLGAAGVAWPTLISRMIAAGIMIYLCCNIDNPIQIKRKELCTVQNEVISKILHIALPSAVENGLFQLGRVIVTVFIATYGTSQIAANGVANGLATLSYIGDNALGLAIMTVVGQCVGAGDYKQAKHYTKLLVGIAIGIEAIECAIVYLTLPISMKAFTMTAETAILVRKIITYDCIATTLLHSVAFVLPNALRAAGDVRYSMFVGVSSMFIMRIGGSYIMGTLLGMGVLGVWFAMFSDWTVRIIFFVGRYLSGKWTKYRIV